MAANRPSNRGDQRKRVTAIYWGSSGRRFKSCQPDQVLAGQGGFRTSEAAFFFLFSCRTQTVFPNQIEHRFTGTAPHPNRRPQHAPCHRGVPVQVTGDADRRVPEQVRRRLDVHPTPATTPPPNTASCAPRRPRCPPSGPRSQRCAAGSAGRPSSRYDCRSVANGSSRSIASTRSSSNSSGLGGLASRPPFSRIDQRTAAAAGGGSSAR